MIGFVVHLTLSPIDEYSSHYNNIHIHCQLIVPILSYRWLFERGGASRMCQVFQGMHCRESRGTNNPQTESPEEKARRLLRRRLRKIREGKYPPPQTEPPNLTQQEIAERSAR